MLTKASRYFYDADAVREPIDPKQYEWRERYKGTIAAWGERREQGIEDQPRNNGNDGLARQQYNPLGRNKRSVWEIATQPTPDAHFAVMPEKLVEPCILAGTSERGCCRACGAPWVRVVERTQPPPVAPSTLDRYGTGDHGVHRKIGSVYQKWLDANPPKTTGWQPSCDCPDAGEPVPCQVLDPFGGSGTVARVAERLGRLWTLVEIKPAYVALAEKRTSQRGFGSLADVTL